MTPRKTALTDLPLDDLAPMVRGSDRHAFAEVFQRMHTPRYRYAARILRDGDGAYDVVQDVFLKLWSGRSRLNVTVSFKAFLFTMARNRALNIIRSHQRQTVLPEPNQLADDRPEPASRHDAAELERLLAGWIRELPPRRGEVFALSRFHGLSNAEIARIMGLSKRTVDTHIVHALRDLRVRYHHLLSLIHI